MKLREYDGGKWRADAGMILGRRAQKVFEKKTDAQLWLKAQEKIRDDTNIGIRRITKEQEAIAAAAFDQLAKNGLDDKKLLDAISRFCSIAAPKKKSSLAQACSDFERDLNFGNRSPVYVAQIGRQLNRFHRSFPDKEIHEIDSGMIRDWLVANCASAANRSNRRRELKVFFSWAKNAELIAENPVDRIPRVTVDRGKPETLNPAQVRAALEGLEGRDRALFAIMTFAGLRPSEASEIYWEDIKLDRGFLEATRGFRADNRNVALSENLVAWLRPIAGSGRVYQGDDRKWRRRVKSAIDESGESVGEWPQDILRHTFASHHLEKHHSANELAHQMGHKGQAAMLFRHYKDLVTPEQAIAFWEIFPK